MTAIVIGVVLVTGVLGLVVYAVKTISRQSREAGKAAIEIVQAEGNAKQRERQRAIEEEVRGLDGPGLIIKLRELQNRRARRRAESGYSDVYRSDDS